MFDMKDILDYKQLVSWMGKILRASSSNIQSIEDGVHPEADFYLTQNTRLSASKRLAIYSIDYWSRCLESLDEDFPSLAYLLGTEKLHQFWERYLQVYPSASFTLKNLGQFLPLFFQQSQEPEKDLYREIVQFEFALIESFEEASLPVYDPEHLTEEQQIHLAEIPFLLQPSVRILDLEYVVESLREAQKEEPPQKPSFALETSVIIFRKSLKVYYRRISRLQARFFRLFQQPISLESACSLFIAELSSMEMERFQTEIQGWMQMACSEQWLALFEQRQIAE